MGNRLIHLLHEEKPECATTALMRKNILAVLEKHYPHMCQWPGDGISRLANRSPWVIDIKDFKTGGIVTIRNLLLSGEMGVTIKMVSLDADPDYRSIIRFVGELLERYNITREKCLDIRDDIYGLDRDFRGHAIAQT